MCNIAEIHFTLTAQNVQIVYVFYFLFLVFCFSFRRFSFAIWRNKKFSPTTHTFTHPRLRPFCVHCEMRNEAQQPKNKCNKINKNKSKNRTEKPQKVYKIIRVRNKIDVQQILKSVVWQQDANINALQTTTNCKRCCCNKHSQPQC